MFVVRCRLIGWRYVWDFLPAHHVHSHGRAQALKSLDSPLAFLFLLWGLQAPGTDIDALVRASIRKVSAL